MDERLRERFLERVQYAGSAARMPETRPGGRYGLPFGLTPASPLDPRRVPLSCTPEEEEPMQLGRSRLSPETRDRLYLYCGKVVHIIQACPVRPKDPAH